MADAVTERDWHGGDEVGSPLADVLLRCYLRSPDEAPRAVAALMLNGYADQALLCAQQCLALITDLEERAELRWLMALAQLTLRDTHSAVGTLTRALHEARGDRWAARLAALLASARLLDGDAFGALQARHQLTDSAVADDHVRLGLLHFDAAVARFGRDSQRAHALLDAAEQLPAYDTDPGQQIVGQLLRAELYLGQAPLAFRELERAAPLVRQIGGMWLDWWTFVDCLVWYNLGDWDETLARADRALAAGVPCAVRALHGLCAIIHTHRGNADAAAQHVEDARKAAPTWALGHIYEGIALLGEAVTAEARGDADEVVAVLRRIVDDEVGFSSESTVAGLGCRVVRMALAADDVPLAEELTLALEKAGPESRPDALLGRALLSGDVEQLATARDELLAEGSVLEAAWAEEELACQLARAGRAGDARVAFAPAHETFRTLSAVGELCKAEATLRGEGIRIGVRGPRARARTGWDSLSPTELRVAELVGKGLTNPDIGRALHISPRTVQSHVSRILAKLDLGSRAEIAAEVARRG